MASKALSQGERVRRMVRKGLALELERLDSISDPLDAYLAATALLVDAKEFMAKIAHVRAVAIRDHHDATGQSLRATAREIGLTPPRVAVLLHQADGAETLNRGGGVGQRRAAKLAKTIAKDHVLALGPLAKIPTAKQISAETGLDMPTVHAAYRLLREAGLTVSRGSAGTRVVDMPEAELNTRVQQFLIAPLGKKSE